MSTDPEDTRHGMAWIAGVVHHFAADRYDPAAVAAELRRLADEIDPPACGHPESMCMATLSGPGSWACACGHSVDTLPATVAHTMPEPDDDAAWPPPDAARRLVVRDNIVSIEDMAPHARPQRSRCDDGCDEGAMLEPGVEYTDGQIVPCPECGHEWRVCCDAESEPHLLDTDS